jgi:hypothetical protein
MADFTRKTRRARPKFSIQDNRAADTVADHHVKQITAAQTSADFELSISSGVRVVFELNSQSCGSR